MAASPQAIDMESLRKMTGDARVRTQAAVAKVFGVSTNTVKQNWATNGMPGITGDYPVWEIAAWWIERERSRRNSNRSGKPLDPIDARLREIELRVAELGVQRKEREEREAQGLLVDPREILAAIRQLVAMTREALMKVPAAVEPQIPRECASEIVESIRREITLQLIALAEGASRAVGEEPQTGVET